MTEYRHGWKHEISLSDRLARRQRLRVPASPDPRAAGGRYLVRSLYFDTPEDRALREKLNGVSRREKFRLRHYDRDLTALHLEKKNRRDGLGTKDAAPLSRWEVRAVLAGDCGWIGGGRAAPASGALPQDAPQGLRETDFLNPDCVTVPAEPGLTVLEVKWDAFLPLIRLPERRFAPEEPRAREHRGTVCFDCAAVCRFEKLPIRFCVSTATKPVAAQHI